MMDGQEPTESPRKPSKKLWLVVIALVVLLLLILLLAKLLTQKSSLLGYVCRYEGEIVMAGDGSDSKLYLKASIGPDPYSGFRGVSIIRDDYQYEKLEPSDFCDTKSSSRENQWSRIRINKNKADYNVLFLLKHATEEDLKLISSTIPVPHGTATCVYETPPDSLFDTPGKICE